MYWLEIRSSAELMSVCAMTSERRIHTGGVMNAHTEPAAGAAPAGPVMPYPAPNAHRDPSGVTRMPGEDAAESALSTMRAYRAEASAEALTWIVPTYPYSE